MFYESEPSRALRFGDILQGFVFVEADVSDPKNQRSYKINVKNPSFSVVMTPCCSIGKKVLSLTPLIEIRPSFFDNPYFEDDLTRINRTMRPEETVSPTIWQEFPPEEKAKRLRETESYAVADVFIYEKHDLLPPYPLLLREKRNTVSTNYYMIDFKNIYIIKCDKVNSAEDSPYDLKNLELTVQTRNELRNKLGEFFKRRPLEDRILED
jgi:hypothetical protein